MNLFSLLTYARKQKEIANLAFQEFKIVFAQTAIRFSAVNSTKAEEAEHKKNIAIYDRLWAEKSAKDNQYLILHQAWEYSEKLEKQIRLLAYTISQSPDSASEVDNWLKAEKEILK